MAVGEVFAISSYGNGPILPGILQPAAAPACRSPAAPGPSAARDPAARRTSVAGNRSRTVPPAHVLKASAAACPRRTESPTAPVTSGLSWNRGSSVASSTTITSSWVIAWAQKETSRRMSHSPDPHARGKENMAGADHVHCRHRHVQHARGYVDHRLQVRQHSLFTQAILGKSEQSVLFIFDHGGTTHS